VDHRFTFVLLGAQKGLQSDGFLTAFRFNPRVAVSPSELPTFLANPANLIFMRRDSLVRFSPDSLSVMEFQTQRDYEVTKKIYDDWTLLGNVIDGLWRLRFTQELNMTSDRHLFNKAQRGLPLYEGKMTHQFDAYFAKPRYWVEEKAGRTRLLGKGNNEARELAYEKPRLVFRDIARSTDERTLIAAVVPPFAFCNNKVPYTSFHGSEAVEHTMLFVSGILNSFVLDYIIRQKVSVSLNFFYLHQLPLPRLTAGNPYFDAIVPRAARLTCTTPDFAQLWQEVMGEEWDESKGATDLAERQTLRDELDALVAHLYSLSRDDFAHILGTFPLVFPDDDAGEAKKEALLAIYDRFAEETKSWGRECGN